MKIQSFVDKKKDLLVPEPARLMKYAENVKMIQEHNERYEKGLVTYKMGLNEMSDWVCCTFILLFRKLLETATWTSNRSNTPRYVNCL